MQKHHRGFTLIEISIVIGVIGLLIGGIVVGRSMIRNAERQGIAKEMQEHITAIGQFKDKYYALPGDFSAGYISWPDTGDGDGDGRITDQTIEAPGDVTALVEQFLAWQHLALAGFVEGNYTGVSGDGGNTQMRVVGTNVPASRYSGAGWGLVTLIPVADPATDLPYITSDIPPNTVLWFGGNSSDTYSTRNYMQPVLSAEDAFILDDKFDDSIPTTGKIVAQTNPVAPACYASSAYSIATNDRICALVIKTGF